MRKDAYFAALAAIAFASAVGTAALISPNPKAAEAAAPAIAPRALFRVQLSRLVVAETERRTAPKRVRARATKPKSKSKLQPAPPSRRRASASLYERTTAPAVLHEQGCRAAAARTNG